MTTTGLPSPSPALDARRVGPALLELLGGPTAPCSVVDAKVGLGKSTVLYRVGDRFVIVGPRDGEHDGGREIPDLGLVAWVFPEDPALPGLPHVLSGPGMSEVLRPVLPECRDGARLRGCSVAVVRYRPGRRATLRVDAWLQRSGEPAYRRTYYAKVYHDAVKAAAVAEAMTYLGRSAPVAESRLRVPVLVAADLDVPMLVQAEESGTPLDLFLGPLRDEATRPDPRAAAGVMAAAAALAAMHEAGPSAGRPRDAAREAARMVKRSEAVAEAVPELGAELVDLATDLVTAVERVPVAVAGLHGDCKPSQFLLAREAGGTAAVLDFDHAGPGHPAADVGGFTASLRQLGVWQAMVSRDKTRAAVRAGWLADLADLFATEYGHTAPDADTVRVAIGYHEPAALLRKALRAFARSPRSPLPHALATEARRRLDATGTGGS